MFFPALFSNSTFFGLTTFTVTVTNVVNPAPATTYTPVSNVEVTDSSGAIISTVAASSTIAIESQAITCGIRLVNNNLVFALGIIEITFPSTFVNTTSGSSLSVIMDHFYPNDGTQTLINPVFNQGETTQNLGAKYIYTFSYLSQFNVTMLMPPSTKPEINFMNITS